jgi:OOP family OmpA-OmpF porin
MADVCPNTPKGTRVDAVGCGCEVTLGLRFELNSAELTDEDITQLDELVGYMKKIPGLAGMIEGHTDSSGSEAYNQALSERRALSVVDYLRAAGVEADLTAVGYGETRPVADNSTAEGRATNRRVVVSRTDCN